jgi:hypothetical protein
MNDKFRRKTAKYLPCPPAPLCVFIFLSSRDRRERGKDALETLEPLSVRKLQRNVS